MSVIAMYGAPPFDTDRWVQQQVVIQPHSVPPLDEVRWIKSDPIAFTPPSATGDALVAQLKARAEWLRRELAQMPAWQDELAMLERMLDAAAEKDGEP